MSRIRAAWALLLILGVACAPRPTPLRAVPDGEHLRVTLEYQGDALSLSLVGDFNGWDPTAHPFEETAPRLWRCSLSLAPGRYAYLLRLERPEGIVLVTDPLNPRHLKDGSGLELSLMELDDSSVDASPPVRPLR